MYLPSLAASVGVGVVALWLFRGNSGQVTSIHGDLLKSEPIHYDQLFRLGGLSPWVPKVRDTIGTSNDVPSHCIIDQVHLMSRHAERYPTGPTGIRMLELFQRIRHADIPLEGDLAFANDWDFFAPHPSEQFEQLTTTGPYAGSLSAFQAGVTLRGRYLHLLEAALQQDRKISFWAGLSDRVVDSAKYFAASFFGIEWQRIATLHIIPETQQQGADTLTPGRACPNYATDERGHAHGVKQLEKFRESYIPAIIERLQKDNPDFPLSVSEVFSMQEMCAFELLVKGQSLWCEVFTEEEMLSFEYARDVLHYYRAGPGNSYGPALGWLWLNATARLLQEGPDAGPLFLSFNHDGDIIAMVTALDLFPQQTNLPTTHVDHTRTWRMSDVVPMGARFILERLVCAAPQDCWDNGPLYPNHVYCSPATNNTYVRVNINDGIVAIPGCDDGPGGACELSQFTRRIENRGRDVGGFAELCGLEEELPRSLTFLHQ